MIQEETQLVVADNSGATMVQCIRVLGDSRRRYARLGDLITVTVKKANPHGGLKKKTVTKALVVRQKQSFHRKDGSWIRFDDNAVILMNKEDQIMATRVFGPIAREIKEAGFSKVASMAPEVL